MSEKPQGPLGRKKRALSDYGNYNFPSNDLYGDYCVKCDKDGKPISKDAKNGEIDPVYLY